MLEFDVESSGGETADRNEGDGHGGSVEHVVQQEFVLRVFATAERNADVALASSVEYAAVRAVDWDRCDGLERDEVVAMRFEVLRRA